MATFAENLKGLPSIENLEHITLYRDGQELGVIPNAEGKRGSLQVYNYLTGGIDGIIDASAAAKGLELFAEKVDEAKAIPGKHPNIEYLLNYTSPIAVRITYQR